MADTGSDREPRPRRGLRLTLRLRLTLLYGGVFIAAGAGLLTATYALFKHNQAGQGLAIRGVQYSLPVGATAVFGPAPLPQNVHAGAVTTVSRAGSSGRTSTTIRTPPGTNFLSEIKSSGQRQLLFLAARANARLRASQNNDASSLLEWSAIALAGVALLSICLAWWLAGRALRPLRTMNRRAREISADNLHERLGVEGRADELGDLATTFDALLSRLQAAFESQRRFVANASHELRTPITLERTLVEVALADPDASADSLRHVCERVVSSTEEQERLLDALLTLARSEAGVGSGREVDLSALVEDALISRENRLQRIKVESSLEPAPVVGDQALLERLVANLVDNAIVHNSGEARWIHVATGVDDGPPYLRVANSGGLVAEDELDELFEPFRRGAGDRLGSESGGLGLGLSIVRAIAAAHGAQLDVRTLPDGGLEFTLGFADATGRNPPSTGSKRPPRNRAFCSLGGRVVRSDAARRTVAAQAGWPVGRARRRRPPLLDSKPRCQRPSRPDRYGSPLSTMTVVW